MDIKILFYFKIDYFSFVTGNLQLNLKTLSEKLADTKSKYSELGIICPLIILFQCPTNKSSFLVVWNKAVYSFYVI